MHHYNPSFVGSATRTRTNSSSLPHMTPNEGDSNRRNLFGSNPNPSKDDSTGWEDSLKSITNSYKYIEDEIQRIQEDASDLSKCMSKFVVVSTIDETKVLQWKMTIQNLCSDINPNQENDALMDLARTSEAHCKNISDDIKNSIQKANAFLNAYRIASELYHQKHGHTGTLTAGTNRLDESMNRFVDFVNVKLSDRISKIQSIIDAFKLGTITIWSEPVLHALFTNEFIFSNVEILKQNWLDVQSLDDLSIRSKDELLSLLRSLNNHRYRGTANCVNNIQRAVENGVISDPDSFLKHNKLYCHCNYNKETLQGLVGIYLGLEGLKRGFAMRSSGDDPMWDNRVKEGVAAAATSRPNQSVSMQVDSNLPTATQEFLRGTGRDAVLVHGQQAEV